MIVVQSTIWPECIDEWWPRRHKGRVTIYRLFFLLASNLVNMLNVRSGFREIWTPGDAIKKKTGLNANYTKTKA